MNKYISVIILLVSSCGHLNAKKPQDMLSKDSNIFLYSDKNGKFKSIISYGQSPKDKSFFVKKVLEIPNREKDNVLEQSIVFSEAGSVKGANILRPKMSQYNVWFDGKKYFSEIKINPKSKSVEVRMVSPENQWNGVKQIKFPSTKAISCFFSQLVECVKISGFLDKIKKNTKAKMSLYVIWEGYPYLNETYSDFPSELFSRATIESDGITKNNEKKFNLNVAGQSIFYSLDENNVFKKMFWVSQGISMVEKNELKNIEQSEEVE
jgi:hypothetical protein